MTNFDPHNLIFREHDQNHIAAIAALFPEDDYLPIVVIADTLEILDGHNRCRVAMERGHMIPGVEIGSADYLRLQADGYDDAEIAYAALVLDGEMDAAAGIDAMFGGIVAMRGAAAYEAL